ncbi:beta-lactamase family protein [Kordiimonas sp. SCSIO 12603]|uniref:serine hydrolase domain-containing protein n=1 Tax=Kordiimonas sp. SCSIO 12603 TaxID=2829596 RepID=UPI002106D860|nr:serine hydrolase domain-containing protein [Kordiimonas sp. SCSIO 12603]UTW58799.1 beta-lactamase family protein [Kordiimonas sp. SCSIO 12603]
MSNFFAKPLFLGGIIGVVLFAVTAGFGFPVQAASSLDHTEKLKADVRQLLDKYERKNFSGSLLVAHKGQVVLTDEFGVMARDSQQKTNVHTIYDVGSLTKQFTGAAIMKLVEEKRLALSDGLQKYFPNIPADKASITIHQLLTHSSGLRGFPDKGDYDLVETDVFFDTVFKQSLRFTPGSEHEYRNVGYSALTRIIELVTNMAYEAYLQQTFFKPLGMFNTGYLAPDWTETLVAEGYARGKKFGSGIARYQDMGEISWLLKGNGGIHSTLGDMHVWLKSLSNAEILTENSIELLTTRHIAEDPSGNSHYGYGWAIFKTDKGRDLVAHNGSNRFFFADVLWLKDEDAWIVMLSNSFSRDMMELAWRTERHLAEYLSAQLVTKVVEY